MKVLCIIPARMNSTRLANKPMALIGDKPLVLHTYESARKCTSIDKLIVATDHPEIHDTIISNGGQCVMTPKDLKTGTDRVAYVAKQEDHEIVINLQGDEPFINPNDLAKLISPLKDDPLLQMSTLASKLEWESDYTSPDLVKVVCCMKNKALYFSRSPLPYLRNASFPKSDLPVYKHMGMYAFKRNFLLKFPTLPQTPLEQVEALEQLRALEHGFDIKVQLTENRSIEVNTPDELEQAKKYWAESQIKRKDF